MPNQNGIDFYKMLDNDPMVIFTTAYSEYAVEGFNVNATDYLLKPFQKKGLLRRFKKLETNFNFVKVHRFKLI